MENIESFFVVKIKGKKCYLMVDDTGQKKWTNNKNDSLCFNNEHEANEFAKNYFKKFDNWEISIIDVSF